MLERSVRARREEESLRLKNCMTLYYVPRLRDLKLTLRALSNAKRTYLR